MRKERKNRENRYKKINFKKKEKERKKLYMMRFEF